MPVRETICTDTINKEQFKKEVAQRCLHYGIPVSSIKDVVDEVFKTIEDNIENGISVRLRGFGHFDSFQYKGRKSRNPQTGETVLVPDKNNVRFRPSKDFTDRVRRS